MQSNNLNHLKLFLPGDKSISHRAIIISSFIPGVHKIRNIPKNEDVLITLDILSNYGLKINYDKDLLMLDSTNMSFNNTVVNCGDSGTTARLMIGYLTGLNISTTILGSATLSKRPMDRIINPLRSFGANIQVETNQLPAILNRSNKLETFDFNLNIPSAQIKSALILYALSLNGRSIIRGKIKTRDHLEILLSHLKYPIYTKRDRIEIDGGVKIKKCIDFKIPGDISSAAFIIAAAILNQNSNIIIKGVCINKYRIGFLRAITKMGAKIKILNKKNIYGEEIGDISAQYSKQMHGIIINKTQVVDTIDEIPILSVIACFASGTTIIEGIKELKIKESDRVLAIIDNINSMGGEAKQDNDNLVIKGKKRLYNTYIKSFNDHRIFMSFYIANRLINKNLDTNFNDLSYKKSFPEFLSIIDRVFK